MWRTGMGNDMVVALKEASANGTTLFALNHYAAPETAQAVRVTTGRMHDPGERSHTPVLALPQARQTFSVLGVQTAGQWGYTHGVNENKVSIGLTAWRSRLTAGPASLSGPDLVRLALERGRSAYQAVEILADLMEHHGQSPADNGNDSIFLIADAKEAYVMETAGRYWALLECGHSRVVTDVAMIRQDWSRLAPGLASFAIDQGWAQDDGSKIDFAGCLGKFSAPARNAQKRWGRASLHLAQQQGAIDLFHLRRMLAEHFEDNRIFLSDPKATLVSNFLVDLHTTEQPLVAWVSFGLPMVSLAFPVCMIGELPASFGDSVLGAPSIQERTRDLMNTDRAGLADIIDRLQSKFDQDADEFLFKAHDYAQHGKTYLVSQLATEMMHHHVTLFETECRGLVMGTEKHSPHRWSMPEQEVMFFA